MCFLQSINLMMVLMQRKLEGEVNLCGLWLTKSVLLFSLTLPASAQTCLLRHASFYQSVLSSGPCCEVDISDGKLNDYLLNLMTYSPGLKMLAITYIMYKINCSVQRHLFFCSSAGTPAGVFFLLPSYYLNMFLLSFILYLS